jgi:hypothetical protein
MNCQTIQTIQKIAKDQAIVKSARDDPPRAAETIKRTAAKLFSLRCRKMMFEMSFLFSKSDK